MTIWSSQHSVNELNFKPKFQGTDKWRKDAPPHPFFSFFFLFFPQIKLINQALDSDINTHIHTHAYIKHAHIYTPYRHIYMHTHTHTHTHTHKHTHTTKTHTTTHTWTMLIFQSTHTQKKLPHSQNMLTVLIMSFNMTEHCPLLNFFWLKKKKKRRRQKKRLVGTISNWKQTNKYETEPKLQNKYTDHATSRGEGSIHGCCWLVNHNS